MSDTLCDILARAKSTKFATDAGTDMHTRLRTLSVNDGGDLACRIAAIPELMEYFVPTAQTEVPIAGTIGGKFISRRIDRMVVDSVRKTIKILDYKTDTDHTSRREKYIFQLREYCELLHQIYPDHQISASILWTHDWRLEQI